MEEAIRHRNIHRASARRLLLPQVAMRRSREKSNPDHSKQDKPPFPRPARHDTDSRRTLRRACGRAGVKSRRMGAGAAFRVVSHLSRKDQLWTCEDIPLGGNLDKRENRRAQTQDTGGDFPLAAPHLRIARRERRRSIAGSAGNCRTCHVCDDAPLLPRKRGRLAPCRFRAAVARRGSSADAIAVCPRSRAVRVGAVSRDFHRGAAETTSAPFPPRACDRR